MSHCERICPAFCRHWPSICPASRTPFTSVLACSLRAFCVHLASLVKHSACVRHAMGRLFLRAFRLPSASLLHASGEHLLVCAFLCLVFARTAKSKKISTLLDLCVSSLRRGHANLLCAIPNLTDNPRRVSNKICLQRWGQQATVFQVVERKCAKTERRGRGKTNQGNTRRNLLLLNLCD